MCSFRSGFCGKAYAFFIAYEFSHCETNYELSLYLCALELPCIPVESRQESRLRFVYNTNLPSCCCIDITTEFICALEAYSLLVALRDCTSSLARILATSICPFLAASLIDLLTFASSLCIPGAMIHMAMIHMAMLFINILSLFDL